MKEIELENIEEAQSHLLLAKIGKRVLRPGGKELTKQLVESLHVTKEDVIAEFAPGSGFTAELVLQKHPKEYIGIDREKVHIENLKERFKEENIKIIEGNAEATGLPNESVDKVYGEAMLSMHHNIRKARIIKEAARILKKGGYYAIHELELNLTKVEHEKEAEIQKELAHVSHVNARPQTLEEWTELLANEGFKVIEVKRKPLRVLEPARMIDDEGFFHTLHIAYNVLSNRKIRKRVFEMRRTFNKHEKFLNAVMILAVKEK